MSERVAAKVERTVDAGQPLAVPKMRVLTQGAISRASDGRPVIVLYAFPSDEGSSMLAERKPIPRKGKAFPFYHPLSGPQTPLRLEEVDAYGKVIATEWTVTVSPEDWSRIKQTDPAVESAPRKSAETKAGMRTQLGLGVTSITYLQSRTTGFSSVALTAKGGLVYAWAPGRWSLGLTSFITMLPMTNSRSDGKAGRFLGVNLRAAYALPLGRGPWALGFAFGGYFSTMFVTDDAFGYQNVAGPQLYPSLRRRFANGESIGAYAKYSPVSSGLSLMTLANREIAFGIDWNRPLQSGESFGLGLDISNLVLYEGSTAIDSSTVTIGLNYGF